MIAEALNFAATYALTPRRHAGEINSSVTLWARARRCARDWAEHERRCHRFILEAIEALPGRRTVVVLGSGLLRDVPIEALASRFETVLLYDLQHLASVRLWARFKRLGSLSFVSRDLSGQDALRASPQVTPEPLAFLQGIEGLDLVISANLLSQIGVGIGRIIKALPGTLPNDAVPRLITAHLQGLSTLACPTCLLTDVSYEVLDNSGVVLERDDLMHGVALPAAEIEWQWPVAPLGELDPGYRAVHRVLAISLPVEPLLKRLPGVPEPGSP